MPVHPVPYSTMRNLVTLLFKELDKVLSPDISSTATLAFTETELNRCFVLKYVVCSPLCCNVSTHVAQVLHSFTLQHKSPTRVVFPFLWNTLPRCWVLSWRKIIFKISSLEHTNIFRGENSLSTLCSWLFRRKKSAVLIRVQSYSPLRDAWPASSSYNLPRAIRKEPFVIGESGIHLTRHMQPNGNTHSCTKAFLDSPIL